MIEFPMLTNEARDADATDVSYAAYRAGLQALYEEIEQELVAHHGGRPHWGLWFSSGPDAVHESYGEAWEKWKQVYAVFNAHGLFSSAFTRRMNLSP